MNQKVRVVSAFVPFWILIKAMLGRQGWELLQNPYSLVSRIYQARYFPCSSFIQAVLGPNQALSSSVYYQPRICLEGVVDRGWVQGKILISGVMLGC